MSPQEERARTADAYMESHRSIGILLTRDEANAMAVADLELVDAAARAGELDRQTATKPAEKPAVRDEHGNPLTKALAETGTRLSHTDAEGDNPNRVLHSSLHANPQDISPRFAAATARLGRILEGSISRHLGEEASDNAAVPELARAIKVMFGDFMFRKQPAPSRGRVDHNPFRGMSDHDANLKLRRMVEDIADRSTKWLGHWWVK